MAHVTKQIDEYKSNIYIDTKHGFAPSRDYTSGAVADIPVLLNILCH